VSRNRDRTQRQQFDRARDELFSHIHRCGVLSAAEEHQIEWLDDTIEYIGERYPSLGSPDLEELKQIGLSFCRPVIANREDSSAEAPQVEDDAAANEAAAA
jgi:hypothetical protein